jgi:hypothetical protein
MPSRTLKFTKIPWTGGINTSVDQGVVSDNDLTVADNVVFSSTSARVKREGNERFDALSDLPALVSRASAGTTRTLVFASELQSTTPDIHRLNLGERIDVDFGITAYDGTYAVTSITSATITYTAVGSLTETTTAVSSTATVSRRPYIDAHDFWYANTSGNKLRLVCAFTDQGKLFKFDSSGRRIEIVPKSKTFTTVDQSAETATITGHGFSTGQRIYLTTTGTLPSPLVVDTAYYLISVDANTVKFADSLAHALAGTPVVNLASAGSGTHTITIRRRDLPSGSGTLTRAQSIVFNNKLIIVMSGTGNYPIIFDPQTDEDEYYDLAVQAPDCDMISEHLSRLWTNDKVDRDLLHLCSTFDHTEWLGIGDSWAIPLTPGDGDSVGISAIFPTFKDALYVTKKSKTYRITGTAPEDFDTKAITSGLGSEGPRAVATVDLSDVVYLSERGIHSLAATAAYGDLDGSYLSSKIKPTFDTWDKPDLKRISAVYIPDLNSVAFNVTEYGEDNPSSLWLYNVEIKEWYRWPSISAVSIARYLDADERVRILWATTDGKLNLTQNGEYTDYETTAIRYQVKTGQIYPDSNPESWKHFKKITLMYKPRGRYSFTLKVWVDNLPVQTFGFSQTVEGDALGTNFILGQSVLGSSGVFAPFTVDIEGHGRGIQLEIENANRDEQVELYGFSIEYEGADSSPENDS